MLRAISFCFRLHTPPAEENIMGDGHPHASTNQSPYWAFVLRAKVLRNAASLGYTIHHYAPPASPSATLTRWIDCTLGEKKGEKVIRLDLYVPKDVKLGSAKAANRPGVIIFHGGGFVLGQGTDDARWAGAVCEQMGAAAIAVSYRLAPEFPFPTPVEDCASSILHVTEHAKAYGIDPTKLFISGFSAGGNLAFSSHHLLHSPSKWGYTLPIDPPPLRGIIAFYPLLDYSLNRPQKRSACEKPEFTLAPSLTTLFDSSYLPPGVDLFDCRLSPGIAPDEMIEQLPSVHLALCEYDMLHAEGIRFKERLESKGINVSVREIKGEKHAWDKRPSMSLKPSVKEEYDAAIAVMERWLDQERK
ncbi:hypothetical protein C365_04517 [Cryptococcus neoformans Bt85]|nr:hypothetical protein C365_04517 [Cryptococcus neoformans var. grubii Bt85]